VQGSRLLPAEGALERAVPWLAAAAVAAPVLVCRYPPMMDLPCHEEIVAAMRHFGDASRYPPGLLAWNLGHPNQLFYVLACALAFVLPVDLACKVVVAASVAAVPLAAGRLADHLRASRWTAVLVAPLGLGFFFYFGFVGNLLSLGMLLASMPTFDRLASSPSPTRAGGATLILLLLYVAHDSAIVIGGMSIVVLSLGRPVTLRGTACRAAPLVVGACVMVAQVVYAMHHLGPNLRALPRFIDLATWQKIDQLPEALLGLHGSMTTRPAFFLIAALIALLALHRMRAPARAPREPGVRPWLDAHRFELLGVVLIVSYFVVPFAFAGAMWLHARFLTPGIALLAIALSPRLPLRMPTSARLGSVVAVAAVLALVRPEMVATGAVYSDLDPILERIAPGSAIAPLDLSGGVRRWLVFSVAGAASRASAERGGRMAASFIETSPIPAVIIAPGHRWEDSLSRMAVDTLSLEPAFDLRRFRYVLAWTAVDDVADVTRALLPEARLVTRSGGWLLFESTQLAETVLSAEPPSGREESLRARLDAIAQEHRASGAGSAPPQGL
jgi:hypothetical protein